MQNANNLSIPISLCMKQAITKGILTSVMVLMTLMADGNETEVSEPKELSNLRANYEQKSQAALKPVKAGYEANLKELIKTLTDRGDSKGLIAVAEELRVIQTEMQVEQAGGLFIVKATYGIPGRKIDVTDKVRNRVFRGHLTFPAGRGNFDVLGDPAFGHFKTLTIQYRHSGQHKVISKKTDQELTIP